MSRCVLRSSRKTRLAPTFCGMSIRQSALENGIVMKHMYLESPQNILNVFNLTLNMKYNTLNKPKYLLDTFFTYSLHRKLFQIRDIPTVHMNLYVMYK
jgi:hypothetical protein